VSALFVTGTDTGVGKTYVTAALAAACSASGRRVAVLKAAQTGDDDDAAWIAARVPGIAVRTALRYEAPVAPVVAARLEGAPEPSLEPIVTAARELRASADGILVEGSGGLLVPISRRETFAEVALALPLGPDERSARQPSIVGKGGRVQRGQWEPARQDSIWGGGHPVAAAFDQRADRTLVQPRRARAP